MIGKKGIFLLSHYDCDNRIKHKKVEGLIIDRYMKNIHSNSPIQSSYYVVADITGCVSHIKCEELIQIDL